jgi:hypothetical protein
VAGAAAAAAGSGEGGIPAAWLGWGSDDAVAAVSLYDFSLSF